MTPAAPGGRVQPGGGGTIVLIPAYNEAEALPTVLADVAAAVPDATVLVVDDGSADATGRVAQEAGAIVVPLPYNSGVGAALRAGLLAARYLGAEAVVQCDADGQHPPEAIASLLEGLSEADVVIGARFAGVGTYEARGPRAWGMRLLSAVLSRVHRVRLTDTTSGFRAFGPRAIGVFCREMPTRYLGDTVEALVIARAHGLRVAQVPVAMRERIAGCASQGPLKSTVYLARSMVILAISLRQLAGARRRRRKEAGQ
jgi:glycosyltransferase involved in cell wall biosynthesis